MIFGKFGCPAMGVKGAALATTIAETVGDLIILIYVLNTKGLELRPSFANVIASKLKPYFDTLKMGLPAACEDFAWNFGNIYLIAMLNKISKEAAGIHSIVFGVELIAVAVISAIGMAALTLSGYETGKGNLPGVRKLVRSAIGLSWIISVANLVLFMAVPEQLLALFTTDKAIIAAAPIYLFIVGVDLFPKSGNIIVGSGIKGYGEPSWMLFTQIFGTFFIIGFSSLLVLGFHMGIKEIFILVVADETLRLLINDWKLRRISRAKA